MKKTAILGILLAALILMLSGCAELFTFNLFDGMEQINTERTVTNITDDPDKSDAEKMLEIEDLVNSDDFIQSLRDQEDEAEVSGTTSTKETILTYLDTVVNSPDATTADKQTALVLTGDIYAKTSGGEELVNNVSNLLTDASSFETATPDELIGSILPSTMYEEDGTTLKTGTEAEEAFTDLLLGFYDANTAYETLGSTLDPNDDTSLEADANLGDITQTALVSNIVANAIDDIVTNSGGTTTTEEAAASLFNAIATGEDPGFSTDFDPFTEISTEGSEINNLLAMSGLADMFAGQ